MTATLRDVALKAVYKTGDDDLLHDFYFPCLRAAVQYDRAVGFFSAAMLSCAAQGLSVFARNGGHVRLVVGADLEDDEEEAYLRGEDLGRLWDRMDQTLESIWANVADDLFARRLDVLSYLVASGQLQIKVALRPRGMFHDKVGVLIDRADNALVFHGSANETPFALLPDFNYESVSVFPSWKREFSEHFQAHRDTFDRLWNNRAHGTHVVDLPERIRTRIARRPAKSVPTEADEDAAQQRWASGLLQPPAEALEPRVPATKGGQPFKMGEHQLDAIQKWKARDGSGVLALATGAGKTITCLYTAVKMYESFRRLVLIVAVPYQNLADQWVTEMAEFGIAPIRAYESTGRWHERLRRTVDLFLSDAETFVPVVVVNQTLASPAFQELLAQLPGNHMLFVGDECHHHGSRRYAAALPAQAKFRMGLSATPEHYISSDANQRLFGYYGPVVATYSLADALAGGVLTPYELDVEIVELTTDESAVYVDLSRQITRLIAQGESTDAFDDSPLGALLMKRSRLLGRAANKLAALERRVRDGGIQPLTLFYCGEGYPDDVNRRLRVVDQVTAMLHHEGWHVGAITAAESRANRQRLMDEFRVTAVDGLVAMRCLDEGIDVPACRTAHMLASSRNPRQYVQRRGRILRKAKGKTCAYIVDYIVRPPKEESIDADVERRLMQAELARVGEFAMLARNHAFVVEKLRPILDEYDLLHTVA